VNAYAIASHSLGFVAGTVCIMQRIFRCGMPSPELHQPDAGLNPMGSVPAGVFVTLDLLTDIFRDRKGIEYHRKLITTQARQRVCRADFPAQQ